MISIVAIFAALEAFERRVFAGPFLGLNRRALLLVNVFIDWQKVLAVASGYREPGALGLTSNTCDISSTAQIRKVEKAPALRLI